MSSILRREETTLLRMKYLADVYEKYKALVEDLNSLAEKVAEDESGDIWLSEEQQRRLLRQMRTRWIELRDAVTELRDYLRLILTRLGESPLQR